MQLITRLILYLLKSNKVLSLLIVSYPKIHANSIVDNEERLLPVDSYREMYNFERQLPIFVSKCIKNHELKIKIPQLIMKRALLLFFFYNSNTQKMLVSLLRLNYL